MIVTPLKTRRVEPNKLNLLQLLDESVNELAEGSILAITSKVVSLCEGSVINKDDSVDKEELIKQESSRFLPSHISRYGYHFTITNHTLISVAGIDESNGENCYILWPRDPQATAWEVRNYLVNRFGLHDVGVVITDSTCQPMRLGTSGISLAHSGFYGLKDYVGTPDLFGRPFKVTHASIAGGIAAATVLTMGEGTEQTPLALVQDASFIHFDATAPDATELGLLRMDPAEDLFAPFLESVEWLPGGGRASPDY